MSLENNADRLPPADDRRSFLRRSFLVGAAGGAALAAPAVATGQQAARNLESPVDDAEVQAILFQIRKHEFAHVELLEAVLGNNVRPRPTFRNLTRPAFAGFIRFARIFENTGVGAYRGSAPAINSRQVLAGAASIALIEGRHAGVLNVIEGDPTTANVLALRADQDFEQPLTQAQVVALAAPFIQSLNNGPPLAFDENNPSDQNDIAILNFAIVLEYLESEFYDLNLRRYYPEAFRRR